MVPGGGKGQGETRVAGGREVRDPGWERPAVWLGGTAGAEKSRKPPQRRRDAASRLTWGLDWKQGSLSCCSADSEFLSGFYQKDPALQIAASGNRCLALLFSSSE